MTIDWTTVVFEMINFGLLVLILARFVFRPVARTLDARKAEIAARAEETVAREAAAAEARTHFETELARLDELAEDRINAALREARVAAEAIIAEARTSAQTELDKGELEFVAARRRTLARFRGEILRLGADAARRVVRELGAPEIELAFARRAAHALEDAAGKAALGPVAVVHGPDADPEAIAAVLRTELGPAVVLELRVDPELVGGVCLHSGGRMVEASVGASLDAWYRSLTVDGESVALGA